MHMMIWVKSLQFVLEIVFLKDGTINETMRTSLLNYVDMVMSSSYELFESSDEIIKHQMLQRNEHPTCSGIIEQVDPQTIRDSQSNDLCHEIKGELLQCSECGEKNYNNTCTFMYK